MLVQGEVATWEEHENPYAIFAQYVGEIQTLGIDEATPFFVSDGIAKTAPHYALTNGAVSYTHLTLPTIYSV